MSGQKLTPWFPALVKPIRAGYYQRYYAMKESREQPDFWDGLRWLLCDVRGDPFGEAISHKRWRGLAKEPK